MDFDLERFHAGDEALFSALVAEHSARLRAAISDSVVPGRIVQVVLGAAGLVALLLSAGGLFGLVRYVFEQRLKEIGIRTALGASQSEVFRLVTIGAMRLTVVGVTLGVVVAAAVARVTAALLLSAATTDRIRRSCR